ncbi:MAG: hypothetical protein QW255_05640 [Candidatus Bilamarchaeaceae archaeon]
MKYYSSKSIDKAIQVAFDAIHERYAEIVDEYAMEFMSDELDDIVSREYVITINDLDMVHDELTVKGIMEIYEFFKLDSRYKESPKGLDEALDLIYKHFDESITKYIEGTIDDKVQSYVEQLPYDVANRLAEMTAEDFDVNVSWSPLNDFSKSKDKSFKLSLDDDEYDGGDYDGEDDDLKYFSDDEDDAIDYDDEDREYDDEDREYDDEDREDVYDEEEVDEYDGEDEEYGEYEEDYEDEEYGDDYDDEEVYEYDADYDDDEDDYDYGDDDEDDY